MVTSFNFSLRIDSWVIIIVDFNLTLSSNLKVKINVDLVMTYSIIDFKLINFIVN